MLIEQYLETLGNQLYTEHNAKLVTEELRDHIESLRSDYLDAGYTDEEAVRKALSQMGSPQEVGMAFNNPDLAYRQMVKLWLFKGLSIGILSLWLISVLIYNYRIEGIIQGISHLERPSFNEIINNLGNLINFFNLFVLGSFAGYRHISHKSWLDFELKPLMILWPVTKQRKLDAVWTVVAVIYGLPALALYLLPAYGDGFNHHMMVSELSFLVVAGLSWYLYQYGEKQRLPKAIVVEEGLVVKDKFVSWTAIDQVLWTKETAGQRSYYKLTLSNAKDIPIMKAIEVSKEQRPYLASLLDQRIGRSVTRA